MNAGQRGEWHFPQTDATVVLKEDAALDVVKDVKVTWHTAKNGDLYSEFVLCIYPILSTHTQQWTHTPWTHTSWTHTWSSGQPFMLRRQGSSWGFGALLKDTSVVVLRVERVLYIHSPLLHDYINYAKEIMKIGSDAWSVFMDYETNYKCIICKNQMLNACSVLFSRNGHSYTCSRSFTHMLLLNVIISVLMLWFICVLSCQNSL